MHNLYITRTCSLTEITLNELNRQHISFICIDIDQDADAGQRLLNQTGDLVVPTLELDNGDFISRPSIEKLRELFPQETREAAERAEQEQLLAQSTHRLQGIAAWGRYLNLVAVGCALFWLGTINPLNIDPKQSLIWLIVASILLLVLTLAGKFRWFKNVSAKAKKVISYMLFFFMAYLMGLTFITTHALSEQEYPAFTPVPIVTWLLALGVSLWSLSLLLQIIKPLWLDFVKPLQILQSTLGILSLLGFILSLLMIWQRMGPPPVQYTWFMLFVLTLTMLVNVVFAVARMRTQSAIEKGGPVLYPAFAIISLLVMLSIHG